MTNKINMRNKKWLIFGGYNPRKIMAPTFFQNIMKILDIFISRYDNIILLGDFNIEPRETPMAEFCHTYNLLPLKKPWLLSLGVIFDNGVKISKPAAQRKKTHSPWFYGRDLWKK